MTEKEKEKGSYKATYPVEVQYLDGSNATIEFPRISSGAFFDAFAAPGVLAAIQTGTDAGMLLLIRALVDRMVPGLLDKLTVPSGINLLTVVANKEAGNLTMGEALKTVKKQKSGRSKSRKS